MSMSSNAALATDEITSHVGTSDVTVGNTDIEAPTHPDSSRSYGGSTIRQYRSTILIGLVIVALLVVAVTLSAISLQKSREALALAAKNAEEVAKTDLEELIGFDPNNYGGQGNYNGAQAQEGPPPGPSSSTPTQNTEQNAVGGDYHEQEEKLPVPDTTLFSTKVTPSTASPTLQPTTPAPITPAPTSPQPTAAPTETHPLKPRWFHRDHYQYQALVDAEGNENLHPWLVAGTFCYQQNLSSCDYDAYCPNGKGGDPFHGGPPEETMGWEDRKSEQWSPIANAKGYEWVQVGSIPDDAGGEEGSRCWTWDEFTWANGENILEVRGEEYQQWILCCEDPEA